MLRGFLTVLAASMLLSPAGSAADSVGYCG
jgi:hypothetical protein